MPMMSVMPMIMAMVMIMGDDGVFCHNCQFAASVLQKRRTMWTLHPQLFGTCLRLAVPLSKRSTPVMF